MSATGKIFADSANIYQDQARLLFEFYEKAAQNIVSQEEKIENQIQQLQNERAEVELKRSDTWKWFLTIILFFMYWIRNKQYDTRMAEIDDEIEEKNQEFRNIFRDYKVTKMGVAYVPVADQMEYEDKCFIVDYTGNVKPSEISLLMSRQPDKLAQSLQQIETMSKEAPIVESSEDTETIDTDHYSLSIQEVNQKDYVGKLDRALRSLSFCMSDTEEKSVTLPLVKANSPYLNFLNEFTTSDAGNHPVINVFDAKRFDGAIDNFRKINKLKDSLSSETQQIEDVLRHLMHTIARSVQTVSALKLSSTDKVVSESNELLFKILRAPYNHYSPELEREEITKIRNEKFNYADNIEGYDPFHLRESSRVRYNLFADQWIAEDNTEASVPFGVHQIYEEVVAPMVERLMMENRVERLRIYSHIHDQKLSYLNKWHQDVDAFYRSNHAESADIINNMQQTLSEYVEAYNTLTQLQKTLDAMGETGSLETTVVEKGIDKGESYGTFQEQAEEFKKAQDDFNDYMDRLQEDIQLKAQKFGHVEYFDARLQDGYSNTMAVAADEVHNLDERRKPLAATNPLLAKEAVMLPEPSIENLAYEHLALNLPNIALSSIDAISRINLQELPVEDEEDDDEEEEMTPPAVPGQDDDDEEEFEEEEEELDEEDSDEDEEEEEDVDEDSDDEDEEEEDYEDEEEEDEEDYEDEDEEEELEEEDEEEDYDEEDEDSDYDEDEDEDDLD